MEAFLMSSQQDKRDWRADWPQGLMTLLNQVQDECVTRIQGDNGATREQDYVRMQEAKNWEMELSRTSF